MKSTSPVVAVARTDSPLLAQLTDEWQHLNSALATLLGGTTEEQH